MRLRQKGLLIIDMERDAKVFKQRMPRRQLISPENFDPNQYPTFPTCRLQSKSNQIKPIQTFENVLGG
jgi:hypothetical protein